MSNIVGMDKAARIQPLKVVQPTDWVGRPVPLRHWFLQNICARGDVTLFNGDGGVGKSLLCQQLQTALALGMPWLGLKPPNAGIRSLALYCEDNEDELHRRQAGINRYYSCDYGDLGAVMMLDRVGEQNALMTFSRRDGGQGQITHLYRQVEAMIADHQAEVVIIDTAADTFSGSEIDRESVRTFVQRLRGWAIRMNGVVILTQHPSLAGLSSGSGASGSTGWHNSVRSRVYMQRPKRYDADGEEIPTNERELVFKKANYGPLGNKIRMLWKEGVFVTTDEAGPQTIYDPSYIRETMLDAAADFVRQGIELSPDATSRSGLVSRLRSHKELGRLTNSTLMEAQKRLIDDGKLVIVTTRKSNRHAGTLLRPQWLKYASEQEGNP